MICIFFPRITSLAVLAADDGLPDERQLVACMLEQAFAYSARERYKGLKCLES